MESKKMVKFPGLVRMLSVVAFVALSLGGCKVDDNPSGPGEGGPLVNDGKAGIRASAWNATPGGTTQIMGYYNDASGRPVEGVPIICGSEANKGFFSFVTNPTLTGANGGFSVNVNVSGTATIGSHMLFARTGPSFNGPYASEYIGIMIEAGAEIITVPDAPVGNTTPAPFVLNTYTAFGATSTEGHPIMYDFHWGDGTFTSDVPADSVNEASAAHFFAPVCTVPASTIVSTYLVTVKAKCAIHPTVVSTSSPPLTVTVTRVCP